MNYGLYLAAAGALTNMHRADVLTNNLVNVETVGFKPDTVAGRHRLPERLEVGAVGDPQLLLERLGGGPTLNPSQIKLRQGPVQATGNDLDLAVNGKGFFLVRGGDGQPRFTRDGRFSMTADGDLVTGAGMGVLDTQNRPIRLDRGVPVQINAAGDIIQNDRLVATIKVASPPDPTKLRKLGNNLLEYPEAAQVAADKDASVLQRHVEASAVDPIITLKDLTDATSAIGTNLTMMRYHDLLMGQAINTFGRVA